MSGELRTAMIECWGWWCKRNTFRLFRSFRLLKGGRKMFPGVPCWCTEDEFLTMKSWCMMFKVKWYWKLQMIGHGVSFAKDSSKSLVRFLDLLEVGWGTWIARHCSQEILPSPSVHSYYMSHNGQFYHWYWMYQIWHIFQENLIKVQSCYIRAHNIKEKYVFTK